MILHTSIQADHKNGNSLMHWINILNLNVNLLIVLIWVFTVTWAQDRKCKDWLLWDFLTDKVFSVIFREVEYRDDKAPCYFHLNNEKNYHFRKAPILFWWDRSSKDCSNSKIWLFGLKDILICNLWVIDCIFYILLIRTSFWPKAEHFNFADGFKMSICLLCFLYERRYYYEWSIWQDRTLGFKPTMLFPIEATQS